MKHFLAVTLLLVLVGCLQQTIIVQDPVNTTPVEEKPVVFEEEVIEEVQEPSFDNITSTLIAKGFSRMVNYEFQMIDQTKSNSPFFVSVYGDRVFVIPPRGYEQFINRVYIDKSNMTATGFCRNTDGTKCESFGPFELNYSRYDILTPHDYISSMTNGKYYADTTYERRPVAIILEERDSQRYEVWFDSFYGLPLRVMKDKKIIYQYQAIAYGHASEKSVIPSDAYVDRR